MPENVRDSDIAKGNYAAAIAVAFVAGTLFGRYVIPPTSRQKSTPPAIVSQSHLPKGSAVYQNRYTDPTLDFAVVDGVFYRGRKPGDILDLMAQGCNSGNQTRYLRECTFKEILAAFGDGTYICAGAIGIYDGAVPGVGGETASLQDIVNATRMPKAEAVKQY
jgi:hypothetical protein